MDLDEFDFDSAARVFIGSKARRRIHVPSLSTSAAQERARAWLMDGTQKLQNAHLEQLPIAQAVAGGYYTEIDWLELRTMLTNKLRKKRR